jgi:hypothetical protein
MITTAKEDPISSALKWWDAHDHHLEVLCQGHRRQAIAGVRDEMTFFHDDGAASGLCATTGPKVCLLLT